MASPKSKTLSPQAQFDPQHGRHKWVMALLSSVGGQFMGLDRLYLGCYVTGGFKLFLFLAVLGIVLYQQFRKGGTSLPASPSGSSNSDKPWTSLGQIGYNTLILLTVWAFFDTLVVFLNLVRRDTKAPYTYCRDRARPWTSEAEVRRGQLYAFAMLVVIFIFGISVYSEIPAWLYKNLSRT